jgi:hypothetical protein
MVVLQHSTSARSFESHRGHENLYHVSVACCLVQVSGTGPSLVQRSPTECGVSECERGTSHRRPRSNRAVVPRGKKGPLLKRNQMTCTAWTESLSTRDDSRDKTDISCQNMSLHYCMTFFPLVANC